MAPTLHHCRIRPAGARVALAVLLSLLWPLGEAALAEVSPIPVSPGQPDRSSEVATRCPSFSWSGSSHATGYEVVVLAADDELGTADRGEPPVLQRELPAGVTTWTPDLAECLPDKVAYAWVVRAREDETWGSWSEPLLFRVRPAPMATAARTQLDPREGSTASDDRRTASAPRRSGPRSESARSGGDRPGRARTGSTKGVTGVVALRGEVEEAGVENIGVWGIVTDGLATSAGVRGESPGGIGVEGYGNFAVKGTGFSVGVTGQGGSAGVSGESANDGGSGVVGVALGTNSVGVEGLSSTVGVRGVVNQADGTGVHANGGNGVSGIGLDAEGFTAVRAIASGIQGSSAVSASNDGIFANTISARATGNGGIAVRGVVTQGGNATAIQGRADNAGSYGLDIQGDAGSASLIGHPLNVGVTSFPYDPPTETSLRVVGELHGTAARDNHVAFFENQANGDGDVLLLKTEAAAGGQPGAAENFVTFFGADDLLVGQIDGNGSGGVNYKSSGADYAEYLPRRDPDEAIEPGDIVGLFGHAISRTTRGADRVMAVSTGPVVVGNDPGDERSHLYEMVAFVGQVSVRVRGPVAHGDCLVPSGDDDGVAVAVAPERITLDQLSGVVGRSLESDSGREIHQVRALVGLPDAFPVSTVIATQRRELAEQRGELAAQRAELDDQRGLLTRQRQQLSLLHARLAGLERSFAEEPPRIAEARAEDDR